MVVGVGNDVVIYDLWSEWFFKGILLRKGV